MNKLWPNKAKPDRAEVTRHMQETMRQAQADAYAHLTAKIEPSIDEITQLSEEDTCLVMAQVLIEKFDIRRVAMGKSPQLENNNSYCCVAFVDQFFWAFIPRRFGEMSAEPGLYAAESLSKLEKDIQWATGQPWSLPGRLPRKAKKILLPNAQVCTENGGSGTMGNLKLKLPLEKILNLPEGTRRNIRAAVRAALGKS